MIFLRSRSVTLVFVPSVVLMDSTTKESPTLLEELSAEGLTIELCLRLSDGSSDMVLSGWVYSMKNYVKLHTKIVRGDGYRWWVFYFLMIVVVVLVVGRCSSHLSFW